MALKIPVKAGAISNLTDARFFAAFEVAMLGFCFDPQNENYISPQEAQAIKAWISGPKIVAEFANQDEENVQNIIDFFKPDILQLSTSYSVDWMMALQQKGYTIILDCNTATNETLATLLQTTNFSYYLITEKQFAETDLLHNKNCIVIITTELNKSFPAIQINGTPEKSTGIKLFEWEGEMLDALLI